MESNSIHSFQTESTTIKQYNDSNLTKNPEGNIRKNFPEIRLRRSQRFRKRVQFYGDFESHLKTSTSNKKITKKQLDKTTRHLPLISVTEAGNRTKENDLILEKSGTKDLTRILKQCTFPLLAVRCINEKTGQRQIGVPKRRNISLIDGRVVSQSEKSATNYNIDACKRHFSSTMQEQAILENLLSFVPHNQGYSNGVALKEITSALLHDLQPLKANKINITHDESKYFWI